MLPRAGAEYAYLRETYGPSLGFMSAFVSLVAGFSAPIAAALKALVRYLSAFFPALDQSLVVFGFVSLEDLLAISMVWLLIAIHTRSLRLGFAFNDLITFFKVSGIILIILFGFALGDGNPNNFVTISPKFQELEFTSLMSAFSVSLIFVMFCFSGWNAAAYITHEIKSPQQTLPRALFTGTLLVTLLYLALNALFFYGADVNQLAGVVEVGLVASEQLFGKWGIKLTVVVLIISIFASASAMTIAGPRVYYALGQDMKIFSFLAKTRPDSSVPVGALLLQGVITTTIILSARIDQIIQFAGFTLALFSSLAVSCVIVLRIRHPEMPRPFKLPLYPLPAILFLLINVWMMVWNLFSEYWLESLLSLTIVVIAALLFTRLDSKNAKPQ